MIEHEITVAPTGQRLETLQEIPVSFGRDGDGSRKLKFGGRVARGTPMVRVNGVELSVYCLIIERENAWRLYPGGNLSIYRADGRTDASTAARQKLGQWFEQTAPRIAEQHTDQFDVADIEAAVESASIWTATAVRLRQEAVWADRYAELETMVAEGLATIKRSDAALGHWKDKRVTRSAPTRGREHRSDGPLYAALAVVADGETVGLGFNINGKLTLVPIELVDLVRMRN